MFYCPLMLVVNILMPSVPNLASFVKSLCETNSWLAVCWRNNGQRISHGGYSAGVRPWTRHKCKRHSNRSWSAHQTRLRPTGNVANSRLVLIPGSSASCSRILLHFRRTNRSWSFSIRSNRRYYSSLCKSTIKYVKSWWYGNFRARKVSW